LNLLQLENRAVEPTHLEKLDEVLSTPIDWAAVYKILESEIMRSKNWLLESLELAKNFRGVYEK